MREKSRITVRRMVEEEFPGLYVPKKREDGLRYYDDWAGNPGGVPEDTTKCAAQKMSDVFRNYQCTKPRGHGPDGLLCGTHNMVLEKAKARRIEWGKENKKIREGHTDKYIGELIWTWDEDAQKWSLVIEKYEIDRTTDRLAPVRTVITRVYQKDDRWCVEIPVPPLSLFKTQKDAMDYVINYILHP